MPSKTETTIATINSKLAKLQPTHVKVIDESHKHKGHRGAKEHGGGHFKLEITAEIFAGKPALARHRLIYDTLSDLLQKDIHALSIVAKTPQETNCT